MYKNPLDFRDMSLDEQITFIDSEDWWDCIEDESYQYLLDELGIDKHPSDYDDPDTMWNDIMAKYKEGKHSTKKIDVIADADEYKHIKDVLALPEKGQTRITEEREK